MAVSAKDIAGQLDIRYTRPVENVLGFPTPDGGASIIAYRIEYDTLDTFDSKSNGTPLGYYDLSTYNNVGTLASCESGSWCTHQLGAEIQALSIHVPSGSISSGGFKFKYTKDGSTSSHSSCLDPTPTASAVKSALESISDLDEVLVAREAITSPGIGYFYRITFTGFKVAGNVEQLTLDHASCTSYASEVTVQVSTLHDGGALNPGTAYFLRVRAINSVGISDYTEASTTDLAYPISQTTRQTPRAPPTSPPTVTVYAHVDDGTKLQVFWTRPVNDNGGSISKYIVEWTTGTFGTWNPSGHNATVLVGDLPSYYPWDYNISGLAAGTTYKVRVVAENDQGRGWQNDMSGATDAVAVCQTWIEDCTPLVMPRALPAAPIDVVVGAVNNMNRFGRDFIEVRWNTGSTFQQYSKWQI